MILKHIVLLKFKDNISIDRIDQHLQALESLQKYIDGIISFRRIDNINTGNLSHGFKYGFEMKFANEEALQTYLNHERHKKIADEVIQDIKDFPAGILVIDFNC